MDSLPQLVSAYFDGDLTPNEEPVLRAWLSEGQDKIDDFVINSFVHSQLLDLLNSHQVRANALVASVLPELEHRPPSRRFIGRILTIAVLLAIVATSIFFFASSGSVVATVTGTSNARWTSDGEKRTVGSLLKVGDEISVDGGTLYITFARGGQTALRGPCRFRVESDSSGELLRGGVSAFVPEHAIGFTVRTRKLKLVDLGTEFQINLSTDESCELQVFSGLVELQLFQSVGSGAAKKELQISQGRAVRFDSGTDTIKSIDYDPAMRLPMSAWSR
jgi:ferric-dicitrate binding protein FerR (iron transport regulator)